MYSLVLYQLKPIQQGIQSQHAITEYAEEFFNDPAYRQWASTNKTTIILSVGGSIQMLNAIEQLTVADISFKEFRESDLYDQVTAVCFLADERVWDKKKHPDFEPSLVSMIFHNEAPLREYIEKIGGEKNFFLRSFLQQYKLA